MRMPPTALNGRRSSALTAATLAPTPAVATSATAAIDGAIGLGNVCHRRGCRVSDGGADSRRALPHRPLCPVRGLGRPCQQAMAATAASVVGGGGGGGPGDTKEERSRRSGASRRSRPEETTGRLPMNSVLVFSNVVRRQNMVMVSFSLSTGYIRAYGMSEGSFSGQA